MEGRELRVGVEEIHFQPLRQLFLHCFNMNESVTILSLVPLMTIYTFKLPAFFLLLLVLMMFHQTFKYSKKYIQKSIVQQSAIIRLQLCTLGDQGNDRPSHFQVKGFRTLSLSFSSLLEKDSARSHTGGGNYQGI